MHSPALRTSVPIRPLRAAAIPDDLVILRKPSESRGTFVSTRPVRHADERHARTSVRASDESVLSLPPEVSTEESRH